MYLTSSARLARIVLAVATATIFCLVVLSVAVPEWRPALFEEDRGVEWGTVLCFAAAFAVGLWRILSGNRNDLLLVLAVLASGLAALDELSFGERFIGFDAPEVMGVKLDAVHDLLSLTKTALREATSRPYLVAGGIALVLVALSVVLLRGLSRRGWRIWDDGPRTALFGLAVVLVGGAQMIDTNLNFVPTETLETFYLEEILELAAGVLVLGMCLLRPSYGSRRVST